MNDADAVRTRFTKYLLPVIISSVAFNIPKFFESEVVYVPQKVSRKLTKGRMSAHNGSQSSINDVIFRCSRSTSKCQLYSVVVLPLYHDDYERLL